MHVTRFAACAALVLSFGQLDSSARVYAQTLVRPWSCWSVSVTAGRPFGESSADGLCHSAPASSSSIRLAPASVLRSSAAIVPPGPPTTLTATVVGRGLFLKWTPPVGGSAPASYVFEAGSERGTADLANADTASAAATLIASDAPAGTMYVRVRSRNQGGTSAPSNEVRVTVGDQDGCVASAPSGLTARASGPSVVLAWSPPLSTCELSSYEMAVGSAPGLNNFAMFSAGRATTFTAANVPPGSYYIRVRSKSASGASPYSNEILVSVGPDRCGVPLPPESPVSMVFAKSVTLTWTAQSESATSYVIEAGSGQGLADVAAVDTGSASTGATLSAEPGVYYVRIRARNRCGTSAPSDDAVVVVANPVACASPAHPFVHSSGFQRRSSFALGGVLADYLAHRVWGRHWQQTHPLDILKRNGFESIRVGLTTVSSPELSQTPSANWSALPYKNEYWSSREYAEQIVREASDRGMSSTLFLFLSADAAFAGRQKAPPEWAGLSVAETATRIEAYARSTAQHFRDRGLKIAAYEIGNEIDFGVPGFAAFEQIAVPTNVDVTRDFEWMRDHVWNIEAALLKAAIRGIRSVDPDVAIGLHAAGLAVGDSTAFPQAFFDAMVAEGVPFDYAGLSQPYAYAAWSLEQLSTECWFQRVSELSDHLAGLSKRVVFSEASYPNDPADTVGLPIENWPFSRAGQAAWVRDQLNFTSNQPNISGFFYFYPDHHPGMNSSLGYSALFDANEAPLPALDEFRVNRPANCSATADQRERRRAGC